MKIILGSQSKGRKKILEEMGYEFEVMPSYIDEKMIRFEDPKKLTLALANAKADALIPKISKDAVLITSDQVAVWRGKIVEKPESEKEVRQFLEGCFKDPAETVTAVVVVNTETNKRFFGTDTVKIWLKPLPESIISEYIAESDFTGQTAGFSIEHPLLKDYVKKIDGDISSVIGLPKKLTKELIDKALKL